ncbi:MAG: glycosyltransferase family 39 protein, partial [Beijerinckiaceae bacterium]|nr:glycosyltransferase family 39 protein [Beijerinckiaceae bacterium]
MPSNAPPDAAPDSSPRRNSGRALIALAAIVAVGAFLRFYELDRQCLWLDEAVTVNSARLIHKDGVAVVATRDNVAPLSSWILSAIAPPGRETGAIVRLPAALAGVVAIVLIYALGVVLLDSAAVGLAAAAVAALSPFAVWYAQDGRMYSMLLMFSALCVLCFWPIANGTYKARHLAALTLATALGIYTHQYIVLTSAACGLFLLLHAGWRHKRLWIWLGTQALAALCFVPWLVFAPRREGMMAGSSKGEALFWLPYTFMAQVFGFSYGPSVNELRQRLSLEKLRPDLPWLLPALAGAAAVALAGLIWLVRSKKAGGRFCAVWLFVPTLLAMAAPLLTGRINYNVRYVIGVFPALALVLGAGLLQARRSKL